MNKANKQLPKFLDDKYQKLSKLNSNSNDKYLLELKDVSKIYENGFQAVFWANIKIKKGEFLSLLGPSGCGKTTTLRMIAGLEKVNQGEILINQNIITHSEPAHRNLTMVFQNYALFPHLSVKSNLAFGLNANKKKLGKSGEIYKEMNFFKNKLISVSQTLINIKKISKFEKSKIALNNKIQKLEEKLKDSNINSETLSYKKHEAKIMFLKSNLNFLNSKISNTLKIQNSKADLIKEKNDLIQKIQALDTKRKMLAKTDNFKLIIEEKISSVSKILGLENYLNRKPTALSGGQRQRVALGRSIVGSPNLFLMDEPLSNLDAKLRATMRREIRLLHEKINTGTIYVTHDQIEAMTMSTTIAVMTDGFIVQIGTPNDVYKNPSCLFVASFVGTPSMNLIDGEIKKDIFYSKYGWKSNLPEYKIVNAFEKQKVVLGIRPADFSTDKSVKKSYKNSLKVKIFHKELFGNEIQYQAKILFEKKECEEIAFVLSSYDNYNLEDIIDVYLIYSRVHLFDKESTIALTSEFNFETLESLQKWIKADNEIEIRRLILKSERKHKQKKFSLKKLFSKRKT